MADLLGVSAAQYLEQGGDETNVDSGQINAWTGLIRVDGKPYTWMGAPPNVPLANQTAYEYTTTKSVFTINVDDLVQITATFLSPITPDDFKRQSLIFSYLDVAVKSLDGNEHAVQLYTDITAGECLFFSMFSIDY